MTAPRMHLLGLYEGCDGRHDDDAQCDRCDDGIYCHECRDEQLHGMARVVVVPKVTAPANSPARRTRHLCLCCAPDALGWPAGVDVCEYTDLAVMLADKRRNRVRAWEMRCASDRMAELAANGRERDYAAMRGLVRRLRGLRDDAAMRAAAIDGSFARLDAQKAVA